LGGSGPHVSAAAPTSACFCCHMAVPTAHMACSSGSALASFGSRFHRKRALSSSSRSRYAARWTL